MKHFDDHDETKWLAESYHHGDIEQNVDKIDNIHSE